MSAAISDEMAWLPTDETPLTDAAIAYASHGFRVVSVWWIRPGTDGVCACGRPDCKGVGSTAGKHPIGKAWQKDASSDIDTVRDARGKRPKANIGLVMGGPDRLVAVDIDGEHGRRSLAELEANVRAVPITLTSASGRPDGGEHRIFRVPAHLDMKRLGNRASFRKTGIDTRIEGGQIVAAPSMHASGARYRWTVRVPVAEMPEWLFEALASPVELGRQASPPPPSSSAGGRVVDFAKPYIAKVLENASTAIAAGRPGQRNQLLFAKACTVFEYFVGENLDHLDAWRQLGDAGRAAGLPEGEVSGTLSKAWKRAQTQPRRVPPPRGDATFDPTTPTATPVPAPASASSTVPLVGNWERQLELTVEGYPKKTIGNVITILGLDPRWHGVIAFDAFGDCEVTRRPPPVREQDRPLDHAAGDWSDEDTIRTVAWLSGEHGLDVAPKLVEQAVTVVSRRNVVHPVREYLDALVWDQQPRLDAMLSTCFRASDTEYTRGISARWMLSAVARIYEPGCQADCTLVLESRQHGTGKSTGLELLAGKEWYSATGLNIGDKDSYQSLRRKWIYELGELVGLKGRELHRYKNFLSERVSNYRASYGRRNKDIPRQVIFAGTTNESEYLDDKTGNRRFWPVKVNGSVDRDRIRQDRDQLWAEAVARYRAGEPWHVDTNRFRELCEHEQSQRVKEDTWENLIEEWLESPWVTRHDPVDGRYKTEKVDLAKGITTADVLLGAMRKKPGEIQRVDEMHAAEALRAIGWERSSTKLSGAGGRARRWFKVGQGWSEVGHPGWPSKEVKGSCDYPLSDQPDQPKSRNLTERRNLGPASAQKNSENVQRGWSVGHDENNSSLCPTDSPDQPQSGYLEVGQEPEFFTIEDL